MSEVEESLFCAALVALRDHIDGEDFIESLVVGNAVKGFLVLAAERDRNEVQGCGDCPENLAIRANHLNSVCPRGGVDPALSINRSSVIAYHCELPLVRQ